MNDVELVSTVREFRDGILDGRSSESMCYAVCWPLQSYLAMCGVDSRLVRGEAFLGEHFWLELADGRVLDPTADQFSTAKNCMPSVYLGKLPVHYRVLEPATH